MRNFKIVVSKDNKKYSLVLKAENETIARERVHKEGYSILTIQEIGNNENVGSTFIFEGYNSLGELKHGKIAGDDIFKAYVKLKRDLGYEVNYIYSEKDKDLTFEEKQNIIDELKEEYNLYFYKGKRKPGSERKIEPTQEKEVFDLSAFYANKEIEETNKLIEKVLKKIENIFSGKELKTTDPKRKEKLKQVYNEIIKIQKSTNVSKLKEIGELALTKIGELELEELEETKDSDNRKLLTETNKLLKEFGSKSQFIERDKDIKYQLKSVFSTIGELFKFNSSEKKKKRSIELDEHSHSYVKNMLYLNKYKARYAENRKFIIKNFFKILTNKKLREDTFLARSVIKQNIVLLQTRQRGVTVSYTLLKKGVFKLFDNIWGFFKSLEAPLFIIIILYTFIFLLYFGIKPFINIPDLGYGGITIFIIVILFYLCINLSKNLLFLIINFVIFTFIIIFGVINF